MPARPQPIYFVQWLRVVLMSLVEAHHAGQPYGPTGGDWPVNDPASSPILGIFFALNAAFFMGFFFLLAGYFVDRSYTRKGATAFVHSRLMRLGVPLAFFVIFVFGAVGYSDSSSQMGYLHFLVIEYIGQWQIEMGHLWFIAQLLVFCLLYVLWRGLAAKKKTDISLVFSPPNEWIILLYVLALSIISAWVRIYYPQDDWIRIAWIIPAEPAHLPQYASMFLIGVMAGRRQWFETINPALGKRWFILGLVAFALYLAFPHIHHFLPSFIDLNLFWGFLEAFVCVGLILGLLTIGRIYFSNPSTMWSRLDANVYGVYMVHVFIVVGLQMAIIDLDYSALTKFSIVTFAGLAMSFGLVGILQKIPLLCRFI